MVVTTVVTKIPADFIAQYTWQTEATTRTILNNTVGKVLVIENAELLNDDPSKSTSYEKAAVDTITSMVQGSWRKQVHRSRGRREKGQKYASERNPSLAHRFPVNSPFRFPNFEISELETTTKKRLSEKELGYTPEAMQVALAILNRSLVRQNFSNVKTVDQIIESAQRNWVERVSKMPPYAENFAKKICGEDFTRTYAHLLRLRTDTIKELGTQLNSSIIDQLAGYRNQCLGAWKRGLDPGHCLPMNFVFYGLPGEAQIESSPSRFIY
jgi:hypothetical protein